MSWPALPRPERWLSVGREDDGRLKQLWPLPAHDTRRRPERGSARARAREAGRLAPGAGGTPRPRESRWSPYGGPRRRPERGSARARAREAGRLAPGAGGHPPAARIEVESLRRPPCGPISYGLLPPPAVDDPAPRIARYPFAHAGFRVVVRDAPGRNRTSACGLGKR